MKDIISAWAQFKDQMTAKYGLDWTNQTLTPKEYHEGIMALSEVNDVIA